MNAGARPARQRGQVILFGLFAVLIGLGTLLLMYHAGKLSNDKIRLVNAADAAAYSGGVWVARQYNFTAYTHRSMIVNTLYQAHYTAYVSYIRNIAEVVELIKDATQAIPIVGQVTTGVHTAMDMFQWATEFVGIPVVGGLEASNLLLLVNQLVATDANATLAQDVMQEVGERHFEGRGTIKLSGPQESPDVGLPTEFKQVADDMLHAEAAAIRSFAEIYYPGFDDLRFGQMVGETNWETGQEPDKKMVAFFEWTTTRPHPHFIPPLPNINNIPTDPLQLIEDLAMFAVDCITNPLCFLSPPGVPLGEFFMTGTSSTGFSTYPLPAPFVHWKTSDGGFFGFDALDLQREAASTEFGLIKQSAIGYMDVHGMSLEPAGGFTTTHGMMQGMVSRMRDKIKAQFPDLFPPPTQPARQLTLTAVASFEPETAFDFSRQEKLRTGELPKRLHAASRALVFYQHPDDPSGTADCDPVTVDSIMGPAPAYPDCYATLTNPYWNARLVAGPFVGDLLTADPEPDPDRMPSSYTPPEHLR